ncbi:MAG: helix-turn-helix domain-containing protein, partial [Candidatus Helarchaeota archaeon]
MKASEVLKILGISRSTLYRYRKGNLIKATQLPNKRWDYDEKS